MQGSRIYFRFLLLGGALCLLLAVKGCSNSSGSGGGSQASAGKAGSAGTGGNAGGGSGGLSSNGGNAGAGECTNVNACGGDVVGTWVVKSSCIKVSGEVDLSLAGTACKSAPVTGSRQVTGTLIAKSNGTYTDDTTTKGEEQLTLDASCLVISSTPVKCDGAANLLATVLGYSALTCKSAAGGGCNCSATLNQPGGLGVLSMSPGTAGKYKTSDDELTISGDMDDTKYSYCVAGNKMTVTPQSTSATLTGTIVLEKSSDPGAGGSAGSGGQGGSAGKAGTGGSGSGGGGSAGGGGKAGAGGSGGSGGTSSGGSSGSGGTSSGGSSGSGGTSSGGSSGSGGTSSGGSSGSGGKGGAGGSGGASGPCDIYAAGNTPCVAAHSVVRALYGAYNGKLYQVRRSSDNTTKDILTSGPGGIADTAPEDTFCANSTCVLTVVYDQSGKGNDLWYQGSEQVPASKSSSPAKATADAVTVAGHKIYSLYISPGNCYWHDGSKSGMAIGAEPEGMYMVTSSRHTNPGCCFDYGNSETTRSADVGGAMDAINISTTTAWGSGAGSGPWIMADLEWGLFAQGDNKKNPNDPTQTAPFVTAVLKNNGKTEYAIRGGDATTGNLTTYYKGSVPWNPMKKQGALILGCGGDCCKPSGGANASSGIFFEGAIVTGYPTDATENAIQANIVAAGYGK